MLAAICSCLTHAATNLWPGSLRPGVFLFRKRQRPRRLNSTGPVELRGTFDAPSENLSSVNALLLIICGNLAMLAAIRAALSFA
jgi:hypothetical protein